MKIVFPKTIKLTVVIGSAVIAGCLFISDLNGDYIKIAIGVDGLTTATQTHWTHVLGEQYNGSSSYVSTVVASSGAGGGVLGQNNTGSYNVQLDGRFDHDPTGNPIDAFNGMLRHDTKVVTMVDTAVGNGLSMGVSVAKSTGLTNADINGTYIAAQTGVDNLTGIPGYWTNLLQLTFDGAGNLSGSTIIDSNGDTGSFGAAYSISGDGNFSVANNDASGVFNPTAGIFTLSHTDASTGDVSLMVGLKQGSGLSNASLDGVYYLVQRGVDNLHANVGFWTGLSEVVFDGTGGLSWKVISDSNGDTGTGTSTYSVASDGTFMLGGGSLESPMRGVVNADGTMALLIDHDRDDDNSIQLSIIVRTTDFGDRP